jgi:hypothetical protein
MEEQFMWVPPTWLINAALYGGAINAARSAQRGTAQVVERTTKLVRCEACNRKYGYALRGFGHPAWRVQQMLATWIEAIPCPACGWYQSNMISPARKLHRRWMLYVGRCLTFGLIPLAAFVGAIVGFREPIFVASVVSLFAVGIGMLIWRRRLAQGYDPNKEDADARKRNGQSRAALLSDYEANEGLAYGGPDDRFPITKCSGTFSAGDVAVLVLCGVVLCGFMSCGGLLTAHWINRVLTPGRFEKDLPAYIDLISVLPPPGAEQPRLPKLGRIAPKVKGKMVVVNAKYRRIDDLQFALPSDLWASNPGEVGTVVLLTWEIRATSNQPYLALYPNRSIMIGHVKVFAWESKSEIASRTFYGDPPERLLDSGTGPKPDAQVLNFLKGLPRE